MYSPLAREVDQLVLIPAFLTASALFALTASPVLAGDLTWTRSSSSSSKPRWDAAASPPSQPQSRGWQMLPGLSQSPKPVEPSAPEPSTVVQLQPSAPRVMGLSRGISVNRSFYPDVALTIPNGFKRDPQRFLSLSMEGTNQVRRPSFTACRSGSSSCPDVELNAELALLQSGPASLEVLYNVASVFSDSNNSAYRAQALGFRAAVNLTSTTGLAIGGESQLNLDNVYCPVDEDCLQFKGRTLFAVLSTAIPMSRQTKPAVLTLNAGVGNGYYGFNGNGASDSQWGPFGSISYAFNEYIALGAEYSGYAISAGVSLKPFKGLPLTGTLYVTDFLGNVPSYLENYCRNGDCYPRLLGRVTYSF